MKKLRYVFFIGAFLLLCGCRLSTGSEGTETALNTQTENDGNETVESTKKDEGVYYPAIEKERISEGYVADSRLETGLLYYGEQIYTSVHLIQPDVEIDAVEPEELLGEELGTVYGDFAHWSQDREDLGYIKNVFGQHNRNYELGTLYTVRGYDPDYALCIVHSGEHEDPAEYMQSETPSISFFYKENDIWLGKGRELFCDRMKMDLSTAVMFGTQDDESGNTTLCSFEKDVQEQILEALFEGDFVTEDQVPELSDTFYKCIYLCKGAVFKRELVVYENGYVRMGNGLYLRSSSLWDCIKAVTEADN